MLSRRTMYLFGGIGLLLSAKTIKLIIEIAQHLMKVDKIEYAFNVSDLKLLIKDDNRPQTMLVQGLLKPQVEQNLTHFQYISQAQYHYRKIPLVSDKVSEISLKKFKSSSNRRASKVELLDHLNKSDRTEISIDSNTIYLGDLFTQTSHSYRKSSMNWFKKGINAVLVIFGLPSLKGMIVENTCGIKFGQKVAMIADITRNKGLIKISNVRFMTSKHWQTLIKMFKWQILTKMIFTSILSITAFGCIAYSYSIRLRLVKAQPPKKPTFEHSVSNIMKNPNDDDSCIICYSRARSIIFDPCLHFLVCQQCNDKVEQKCPYCRLQIKRTIKVVEETK